MGNNRDSGSRKYIVKNGHWEDKAVAAYNEYFILKSAW